MRCNLRTVYGPRSAFTFSTNRMDRQTVQTPLSDKTWKFLSVLNEIQFTDRVRTEKCLYDLYKPYGSSNRKPLSEIRRGNIVSLLNEMQFTDGIQTEKGLYDLYKPFKPLSQLRRGNILSVLNKMQLTDRVRTEKYLYDLYKPYGSSNWISSSLR